MCYVPDMDTRQTTDSILAALLDKNAGHVHLVGICGIGMAGLAFLLKTRGFRVSGCDCAVNRMAEWLRARGIETLGGHSPDHLEPDVDWLIRSSAAPMEEEEIRRAVSKGLPVFLRGAVLSRLLADHFSVAVGGTHGKTTTTAFIAQILRHCGRDPSWCVGGECDALGGVAGNGEGSERVLVTEADESDGTIALYRPDIAVLTNVEFDHMEHFPDEQAFVDCFKRFVLQAERCVVYCEDDPRARDLCGGLDNAVSYGVSGAAELAARDIHETASGASFSVFRAGEEMGRVEMAVTGRHNVLNALAAMAVSLELGLTFDELCAALPQLELPRRRFERIADRDGIVTISDYAHHPTEIAALVQTTRQLESSRLLAVFQPHRYSRTRALGADFPPAFEGLDEVVLTPVYPASEQRLAGGSTWDLYAHFRAHQRRGDPADSGSRRPAVLAATTLGSAWAYLAGELRAGDVLLVVGAGDVDRIAEWARAYEPRTPDDLELAASRIRVREPLAEKTTLSVGGVADTWVEIETERDLALVLAWTHARGTPFRILGAGSNVLVSDLGLRGVTARLTGDAFREIREEGNAIVAGAALPMSKFLDWLETRRLGGLEFMEGIPGAIGGAVKMNAGAGGQEIGAHVSWIRCLNPDGSVCIVRQSDGGFGYRRCDGLDGKAVVAVAFMLEAMEPSEIRKRRATMAARRAWMRGMRSAGSVFKNPEGHVAGRLIEQAGLKGMRVGGAVVSDWHGNIIVTEKGASASDVRALMEIVRDGVRERFDIELEPEIVFWE